MNTKAQLIFRIASGIMAAVFLFSTLVQFNDPDPIPWIAIYLSASLACAGAAASGTVNRKASLGIGIIALVWGIFQAAEVSGLNTFLHMFDSFEMKSPDVERARETTGLLIVAGSMFGLALPAFRRRR